MANKQLEITLVRSIHGCMAKHQACIRGLGLRRLRQSVRIKDTPCARGMINKVSYALRVEEVS